MTFLSSLGGTPAKAVPEEFIDEMLDNTRLSACLAGCDWILSLQSKWFGTVVAIWVVVQSGLVSLLLLIL